MWWCDELRFCGWREQLVEIGTVLLLDIAADGEKSFEQMVSTSVIFAYNNIAIDATTEQQLKLSVVLIFNMAQILRRALST